MAGKRRATVERFEDLTLIQNSGDLPELPLTHPWHELVYPLVPGYRATIGGAVASLEPGEALLVNAGCPHRPIVGRGLNLSLLCLRWRGGSGGSGSGGYQRIRDGQGRVLVALRWMYDVHPPANDLDRHLRRALFQAVLCECRRLLEPRTQDCLSGRVLKLMRTDMHRPLNLRELAVSEGLSVRHLLRRFRLETGTSPGRRLQRLRVETAVNLLQGGDDPLHMLARRVGFTSVSHLSAMVLRYTGRRPSSFRRS